MPKNKADNPKQKVKVIKQLESDDQTENNILLKKNNVVRERLIAVNKIFEMYPNLKKDKNMIINNVLDKKEKKIEETILEKVKYSDIDFLRDQTGCLLDFNAKLIGIYIENQKEYKYFLFEDTQKIIKSIINNYAKITKI